MSWLHRYRALSDVEKGVFIQYISEGFRAFSVWGFLTVLTLYLHDALKMNEHQATVIVFAAMSAYNFAAPFGAYIAEYYLGNYQTQYFCQVSWLIGMILVCLPTLNVFAASVAPGEALADAVAGASAAGADGPGLLTQLCSFVGLGLVVVAYGVIHPILPVFIADQFPASAQQAVTASFSWFYFSGTLGSAAGCFVAPMLRAYVSTFASMAALTLGILIGFGAFLAGKPYYVIHGVSPAPSLGSNWAQRLSKAKEIAVLLGPTMRVLAPLTIFWGLVYLQMSIYVFTAMRLNRSIGIGSLAIPADMISSVDDLFVLAHIAVLEYAVYPALTRLRAGRAPSALSRIAFGFVPMALSLLCAGVLELYVNSQPENSVSWMWQLPQYCFNALGEVTVSVSGYEIAYSAAPEGMKNLVAGLWSLVTALGSMLMMALFSVPSVQQNRVWTFFMFAGSMVPSLAAFLLLTRHGMGEAGDRQPEPSVDEELVAAQVGAGDAEFPRLRRRDAAV